MGEGHTDAMKRPKAPPRANPMTPETTVLPGHDSIIICIYRNQISIHEVQIQPSLVSMLSQARGVQSVGCESRVNIRFSQQQRSKDQPSADLLPED